MLFASVSIAVFGVLRHSLGTHLCLNVDSARYAPTSLFPTHRPLILNWFRARRLIALGAVEGFNNKLKLTTRRSYGFRVFRVVEIALYHALGNLPEPEGTHRFC